MKSKRIETFADQGYQNFEAGLRVILGRPPDVIGGEKLYDGMSLLAWTRKKNTPG